MKPYILSADSTLDMPEELIREYDVRVIPSYVTLGEKTVDDWPELTQKDLLDYVNGRQESKTRGTLAVLRHQSKLSEIAINGDRLTDGASVQEKVNNFRPGDTAEITYIRDGKQNTVPVTFHGTATVTGEVNVDGTTVFYGANLKAADAETLRAYGLKGGVSIVSVGSGKMAEAGARSGMIITYVNDEPVSKPEDVIAIAKKARRAVYIQCLDENGKSTFFGFGKE